MKCRNCLVGVFVLLVLVTIALPVAAQPGGYLKLGDIKGMALADDRVPPPEPYANLGPRVHWADITENGFQITPLNGQSPTMTPGGDWAVDSFFDITYEIEFEMPGSPPVIATGNGTGHVMGTGVNVGAGDDRVFDLEMLALNISGMLDPMTPFMLRESPTLASTGETTIESLPGGQYRMDSFFDVFTELSLDGGRTWVSSQTVPETSTIVLVGFALFGIACRRKRPSILQ